MKIALIHTRYKYKGGLETRLFNYINYFLQKGDTVDLYTAEIDANIAIPNGLNLHYINVKKHIKHFRNYFFDKKLHQVFNENNYDFALALERNRVKYLLAPNTHKGFFKASNAILKTPIDLVQLHLEKQSFSYAKIIYACSEMVKNEIEQYYGVSPQKVKVLYPPINLKTFSILYTKEEARAKLNFNSSDKLFLFVSTSHKRKGLPFLKKIFKKLPENYKLLVAGTPIKNTKNIISLGFVKDMSVLYQAVDCLLHPAIYEPFGQIVIEAISQKVPAIVSTKVGAGEFINSHNGYVLTNDIEIWKEKILNFDKNTFDFSNNAEILEELSLQNHMKLMLSFAKLNN
ncbi:MAG: glycosyltransferase family 4 protein [Chitinophagales bacterium]